jgi:NADH:ubiquinone oxidoreductase subunit K
VLVAWAVSAPLLGRSFLTTPRGASPVASTGSAFSEPSAFLSYLWQVFLPPLSFMQSHFSVSEPFWLIYVKRAWAGFGWYALFFPDWVYAIILGAMIATVLLGLVALRREWAAARTRIWELLVIVLTPVAVVVGVEIAFFTPTIHYLVPEMGRYAFPAIGALATLAIAPAFAFGRRYVVPILAGVVTGVVGLSVASVLLGFTLYYS